MSSKEKFVFGKDNIRFVIIGFALSLLGFFLMIGGGSEDPAQFNSEELFSHTRITVAPILVIAGYGVVIFGIMKKSKTK